MGFYSNTVATVAPRSSRTRENAYPRCASARAGLRFYSPGIGKWLSRDPMGETVRGHNLSTFAKNDPIDRVDMTGLWDEDAVHFAKTRDWAKDVEYSDDGANSAGVWCKAVDSCATSAFPWGDQTYHFDRPWGGEDSRLKHRDEHLTQAKKHCTWVGTAESDAAGSAGKELGLSLHPTQDYVAHGDDGKFESPNIWVPHNWFGPTYSGMPSTTPRHLPDAWGLDAVGGPDGRPAGSAVWAEEHWWWGSVSFEITMQATYQPGPASQELTEFMSRSVLLEFINTVRTSARPCGLCRRHFLQPTDPAY